MQEARDKERVRAWDEADLKSGNLKSCNPNPA